MNDAAIGGGRSLHRMLDRPGESGLELGRVGHCTAAKQA